MKINIYKATFIGGVAVFILSLVVVSVDAKYGLFSRGGKTSGSSARSQIAKQRLDAVNFALNNHESSYHFEVPGAGFLTAPMAPKEETGKK